MKLRIKYLSCYLFSIRLIYQNAIFISENKKYGTVINIENQDLINLIKLKYKYFENRINLSLINTTIYILFLDQSA